MSEILYAIDAHHWGHRAANVPGEMLDTLDSMIGAFLTRANEPGFVVAAMEGDGPTFREALYDGYKATRKPDEELDANLAQMPELFASHGIRCIQPPDGFEADDVMATIAAKGTFHTIVLLTGDLDLLQALRPSVRLATHRSRDGVRERIIYNVDSMWDRFGVMPARWPDVLALAGKPSNGYPGLPGIGRKGACQLIAQLGSLDALIDGYRQVSKKSHRLALENPENVQAARLYLQLATLKTDLDIDCSPEAVARDAA